MTRFLNVKAEWEEIIKQNKNQVCGAMCRIIDAIGILKVVNDDLEKIFQENVFADESESSGQSLAESSATSQSAWADKCPNAPSLGVAKDLNLLKAQFNNKAIEVNKLLYQLLVVEHKVVDHNDKIGNLMETISTVMQFLVEACNELKKCKGPVDTPREQ